MSVTIDPDAPGAYVALHRNGCGSVTKTPRELARMVVDADVRLTSAAGIAAVLAAADPAERAAAATAGPHLFAIDDDGDLTDAQLAGTLLYLAALEAVHDILAIEGLAVRVPHAPVRASHLSS